jgi:hypothetical protein
MWIQIPDPAPDTDPESFGPGIGDGNFGSGIKIPDPQHCYEVVLYKKFPVRTVLSCFEEQQYI